MDHPWQQIYPHEDWIPLHLRQKWAFFEASLHCYLLFSPTSAIFLLSRTSSNSKVFGILTTRTSNPFCATATGNVIYRTWRFLFKSASNIVSRDLNARADCVSKLVGVDNYDRWGPRTIDRFACSYNPKLPRFNYSILSAGLRGSPSQNLGYDNNNWLCPPVCLIVRVIRYMKLCRAQGTLVLPL